LKAKGPDALGNPSADVFKDSAVEAGCKNLSPTPNDFAKFVKQLLPSNFLD
jgi:hypothetical protein